MVDIPNIQPFRYQKITNIAEHNQIVDKVNEIIAVVNSLEGVTDGLADDVARLTSDIENINQSIGTINQKLEQHDTQIGDLDDEINSILDRLTQIDKDISGLTSRMSTAEGEIDTLQGQMTTATGNITALQTRMSQAEADIGTLGTEVEGKADASTVTALGNKVTTLEGEVDSKADASDVTALTGRVGTLETEVEGKADASTVTALSTRVTAVEEKNTSQDSQISGLTGRVATAESDIDNLQSGKLDKNQGTANAGKALVVGSDGMVAPGDVGGGGGGGPIVYGWENPNSIAAFNNLIKTLYQSASSAQSSNLGHFNFKQYLPNSDISLVKRIDLTISAVVSNNALKLTPEFCVIFPYTPSGDEVVTRVDVSFNQNGIDYIIIVTADGNITFCTNTGFIEKTEWEFISNN